MASIHSHRRGLTKAPPQYAADFIAAAGYVPATVYYPGTAYERTGAQFIDYIYNFESRFLKANILSTVSRELCLDLARYLTIGGTPAAHRLNFINPALYPMAYVNSATHGPTGILWNAGSYADTGLIPANVLPVNSIRMEAYIRVNNSGTGTEMGSINAGTAAGMYLSSRSSNGTRPYGRTPGGDIQPSTAFGPGLFAIRSGVGVPTGLSGRMSHNAVPMNGGAEGGAEGTYVNANTSVWLGGVNFGGTLFSQAAGREVAGYSIGRTYSDAQVTAGYNAVQELNTLLGRAV